MRTLFLLMSRLVLPCRSMVTLSCLKAGTSFSVLRTLSLPARLSMRTPDLPPNHTMPGRYMSADHPLLPLTRTSQVPLRPRAEFWKAAVPRRKSQARRMGEKRSAFSMTVFWPVTCTRPRRLARKRLISEPLLVTCTRQLPDPAVKGMKSMALCSFFRLDPATSMANSYSVSFSPLKWA